MSLRKLTSIFLLAAAFTAAATDGGMKYKELLREDFSLFTAGSENRPSANPVCDNLQYIPETKTLTPGWQGVEIYQAGGMAFQAAGGRLFTPNIDLSQNGGTFKVSFRMKLALGSPDGNAQVIHSNISSHMGAPLTNEWQTIEFELSGGVKNDYVCIRGISATSPSDSKVKVLIDDIVIEVPDPDLETPENISYSDYDGTSFSAHWRAVAGAEHYELCIFTNGLSGQPEYVEGDFSTDKTTYHFSGLDELWNAYFIQVRSVAGELVSPWSAPVQIEGVATPQLNSETDITSDGFKASWQAVPNAYKYELAAFYAHHTTEAEQFYHINTDFSFVKAVDLGGQFEIGFERLPGWFFGAATLEDGYVGIQGAFAYLGYAAQIESPSLHLASSGGKVSVEFRAKNDDARTGVAVALYNPAKGDFVMADSYETQLSKNWYTVRINLEGGIDGSILAIIPTKSGNVYVDDLKVWQNLRADVTAYRMAYETETQTTSAEIKGLNCPEGDFVGYKVRAVSVSADQTRWIYGAYSDMRYPFGSASIDEIAADGALPEIIVNGRSVTVVGESHVSIYDLIGREIISGPGGIALTLPHSGIYIIRTPRHSTKISIR